MFSSWLVKRPQFAGASASYMIVCWVIVFVFTLRSSRRTMANCDSERRVPRRPQILIKYYMLWLSASFYIRHWPTVFGNLYHLNPLGFHPYRQCKISPSCWNVNINWHDTSSSD
jgi:hypothetical protein